MSVLGAFDSTWSNARATFGEGSPAAGARYDRSRALTRMQSDLDAAAPGSSWSGAAATAYGMANSDHQRVFGELATLDQKLKTYIDDSAAVVASGRTNLEAVRQWFAAATSSLPPGAAGEQMKLAIAQKGIAQIVDVIARSNGDLNKIGHKLRTLGVDYEALNDQPFGKGDGAVMFAGGDSEGAGEGTDWKPDNPYEEALREAGLLEQEPTGYYAEWLRNAADHNVSPETVVSIAREQNLTQKDFDLLNGMDVMADPDGKKFFELPTDINGDDARRAVLMTYILNCDTGYGEGNDLPPTPYSAAEVQRIADRQAANAWSYNMDVDFVHDNGGRLVTTPNGMLMGIGGNWLTDRFSFAGGTAWGDIYMENIDNVDDPSAQLRRIIESGHGWNVADGKPYEMQLDLDRLLHHEERHSRQWAEHGYLGFLDAYASGAIIDIFADHHPMEEDAGLEDGGY